MKKYYTEIKKDLSLLNEREKLYLKAGLFSVIILGLASIIIIPFLLTRKTISFVDYTQTGAIGDTINGIAGPFIALIAAVLTFLAFYVQYKSNVQQREQFMISLKKQKEEVTEHEKTWRVERFENKFYELLKLHKSNVEEMNIGDTIFKRKCFIRMFYELRCCYRITNFKYDKASVSIKKKYNYNEINLIDLSYRIFFFGIGLHSEKHFIKSLNQGEKHLFKSVKKCLLKIQDKTEKTLNKNKPYYTYNLPLIEGFPKETVEFYYFPFDGHVNRLGHYYRHLYQTVTFIINQSFLNTDEKYEYIKTLRAQLSNFEQLMLYYNAVAWFDKEWRLYFTEYRLIKNLPLSIADFGDNPEVHFKKEIEELSERGIAMFEWLE